MAEGTMGDMIVMHAANTMVTILVATSIQIAAERVSQNLNTRKDAPTR